MSLRTVTSKAPPAEPTRTRANRAADSDAMFPRQKLSKERQLPRIRFLVGPARLGNAEDLALDDFHEAVLVLGDIFEEAGELLESEGPLLSLEAFLKDVLAICSYEVGIKEQAMLTEVLKVLPKHSLPSDGEIGKDVRHRLGTSCLFCRLGRLRRARVFRRGLRLEGPLRRRLRGFF